MKYVVMKAFWDYEKEEKWLNDMSAKGMMLTDISWCRYVFTDGHNSEYTYRIELLEHAPTHPESISYIKFMEQSGIECVATYMRWAYFRRKSSDGEFDIYTDIDSKIKHFKRINLFWMTLMFLEFFAGILNIVVGIVNMNLDKNLGGFTGGNVILGSGLLILGLAFWKLGSPIRKKLKRLEQEKKIME